LNHGIEIRQATSGDIPGIVSLLKASLGERLMPKSTDYWIWKHIENPFGASPVLLAVEKGQLVGVRAFMRWQWKNGTQYVNAVRPVDTATHPAYQGRGIFSKLTKALLRDCEVKGVNLVYNTPNTKSLPGYLKMGWQKAGKYPVTIGIRRPVNIISNLMLRKQKEIAPPIGSSIKDCLKHPGLTSLLLSNLSASRHFVTPHTVESLRWRYEKVPVAKYYAECIEHDGRLQSVFFYRLKTSRFGIELRVTDLFLENENGIKAVERRIKEKLELHDADYVSSGNVAGTNLINGLLSFTSNAFGPVVTIREIQRIDMSAFNAFTNWHPSLGDLELF
jgi:GNAT superfamily N-acetyltransferase